MSLFCSHQLVGLCPMCSVGAAPTMRPLPNFDPDYQVRHKQYSIAEKEIARLKEENATLRKQITALSNGFDVVLCKHECPARRSGDLDKVCCGLPMGHSDMHTDGTWEWTG